MARQARRGLAQQGRAWPGLSWQAGYGKVRCGVVWLGVGRPGKASPGLSWLVEAVQGMRGVARVTPHFLFRNHLTLLRTYDTLLGVEA